MYTSNERKLIDGSTFGDYTFSSMKAKHSTTWMELRNADSLSVQNNGKEGETGVVKICDWLQV